MTEPFINKRTLKIDRIYCLLFIGTITTFIVLFTSKLYSGSYSNVFSIIVNKYSASKQKIFLLNNCTWKFDHYSSSAWEQFWVNNITYLQETVCPKLAESDQRNKSIRTLQYIIDLQKRLFNESPIPSDYDELFSKMHYQEECSNSLKSRRIVSQYIEPMIGLLRDPLTICSYQNLPSSVSIGGADAIQSKRFFLLGPSAPYLNFQTTTPSIAPWLYRNGAKKIVFDIGSSYFNGMDGGGGVSPTIGARWFYQYFNLLSLKLDRIFTFEAAQYTPKTYWEQVPDDVIGLLTFINSGVDTKGKFNPWNILKSIATVNDYVIIKLDIDAPGLENTLIQQIVDDKSISSLIDEMFFEMHVTVKEMVPYWGPVPGQLRDTYILFTKLRQLGIRMHSWP